MKRGIVLLLVAVLATSCETTTDESSGDSHIRFYRDPATNVEYVLCICGYGCSMTPRLNPDGTPYVFTEEE